MEKLTPVSWQFLVKRLSELGFQGPFSGGKHPQMRRGNLTLIIPNPLNTDRPPNPLKTELLMRSLKIIVIII